MISNKGVFFVIFITIQKSFSLIELPRVEENDILKAEGVIRSTTNGVFSLFGEKETYSTPIIKHYGYVHNYFVSLTLQDYNCLKEIAKLTRSNKSSIDNGATDFIDTITKAIEENNIVEQQDVIEDDYVRRQHIIEYELEKIYNLKKILEDATNRNLDINKDVLKILEDIPLGSDDANETKQVNTESGVLDILDIWKGDDELGSGRRLYNSKITKIRSFPFMASIQIFGKFQCAGSIIHDDLIITAASCLQLAWNNRFYRENPVFVSVRVGSTFYEFGGDVIGVLEIFFHPSYNPKTIRHNIALMRLNRKIKFKKSKKWHVRRIELDKEESGLPINAGKVTVVGWGARSANNILNNPGLDKIRFALLDIYSIKDCQSIYSKEFVTEQNFCAGFISVGGGACHKDLGGPGIVSGVLTGIISFGAPVCGTPDAPTVFTKVGYYYDWIETIMDTPVPKTVSRTTTIVPRVKYMYAPEFREKDYSEPESKLYTNINSVQRMPQATTISTVYSSPVTKPKIHQLDKKSFREFLKTVFESQELEEYLDAHMKLSAIREQPAVLKKKTTVYDYPDLDRINKTEHLLEVASETSFTLISNVDPQASSSSKETKWWNADNNTAKPTEILKEEKLPTNADKPFQGQTLELQKLPVFYNDTELPPTLHLTSKSVKLLGYTPQRVSHITSKSVKLLTPSSQEDNRITSKPAKPLASSSQNEDRISSKSVKQLLAASSKEDDRITSKSMKPLAYSSPEDGRITSKSVKLLAYTPQRVGHIKSKSVKPLASSSREVNRITSKSVKPLTYSSQEDDRITSKSVKPLASSSQEDDRITSKSVKLLASSSQEDDRITSKSVKPLAYSSQEDDRITSKSVKLLTYSPQRVGRIKSKSVIPLASSSQEDDRITSKSVKTLAYSSQEDDRITSKSVKLLTYSPQRVSPIKSKSVKPLASSSQEDNHITSKSVKLLASSSQEDDRTSSKSVKQLLAASSQEDDRITSKSVKPLAYSSQEDDRITSKSVKLLTYSPQRVSPIKSKSVKPLASSSQEDNRITSKSVKLLASSSQEDDRITSKSVKPLAYSSQEDDRITSKSVKLLTYSPQRVSPIKSKSVKPLASSSQEDDRITSKSVKRVGRITSKSVKPLAYSSQEDDRFTFKSVKPWASSSQEDDRITSKSVKRVDRFTTKSEKPLASSSQEYDHVTSKSIKPFIYSSLEDDRNTTSKYMLKRVKARPIHVSTPKSIGEIPLPKPTALGNQFKSHTKTANSSLLSELIDLNDVKTVEQKIDEVLDLIYTDLVSSSKKDKILPKHHRKAPSDTVKPKHVSVKYTKDTQIDEYYSTTSTPSQYGAVAQKVEQSEEPIDLDIDYNLELSNLIALINNQNSKFDSSIDELTE